MTLNERVFEQNPNLVKMYRFEGENSFHHFDLMLHKYMNKMI